MKDDSLEKSKKVKKIMIGREQLRKSGRRKKVKRSDFFSLIVIIVPLDNEDQNNFYMDTCWINTYLDA